MFRTGVLAAALLVAGFVPVAMGQGPEGFRSPSGNIHCQYIGDEDPTIRCDLRQTSNRPPPRPRDCDLEWGKAFEVSSRATRGILLCHGDTVQDNSLPVLAYGRTWQRRGITCISEQTGVRCSNARGAGFEIARAKQRVF